MFEKLDAGDMHDPRNVERFWRHQQAEHDAVERDKRQQREERHDHLKGLVKAYTQTSVPGPGAGPWRQNQQRTPAGAAVNVSQATAEVQARGFDYLPPERILLMLNDAKNNLEDQWAWPWLEQTVTGPAPLAVPGLKYVLYVRDTDHDLELLGVDVRQVAEHGTISQTGAPGWWWLDGPPVPRTPSPSTPGRPGRSRSKPAWSPKAPSSSTTTTSR